VLVSTRDELRESTSTRKIPKGDSLSCLGEVVKSNWGEDRVTDTLASSLRHPFSSWGRELRNWGRRCQGTRKGGVGGELWGVNGMNWNVRISGHRSQDEREDMVVAVYGEVPMSPHIYPLTIPWSWIMAFIVLHTITEMLWFKAIEDLMILNMILNVLLPFMVIWFHKDRRHQVLMYKWSITRDLVTTDLVEKMSYSTISHEALSILQAST